MFLSLVVSRLSPRGMGLKSPLEAAIRGISGAG